jgi:hypothetical protein
MVMDITPLAHTEAVELVTEMEEAAPMVAVTAVLPVLAQAPFTASA